MFVFILAHLLFWYRGGVIHGFAFENLYSDDKFNHDGGIPPPFISMHLWLQAPDRSGSWGPLFGGVDNWLSSVADPLEAAAHAPCWRR